MDSLIILDEDIIDTDEVTEGVGDFEYFGDGGLAGAGEGASSSSSVT